MDIYNMFVEKVESNFGDGGIQNLDIHYILSLCSTHEVSIFFRRFEAVEKRYNFSQPNKTLT